MSDGNPQAGLIAYEQDIPLSLVAKYCEYNYEKHTLLVRALADMLGGGKNRNNRSRKRSVNIDTETQKIVDYYAKVWEKRGNK